MKIAILHEMLVKFGWAEKVLQSFLKMFPEADLYTLIYDEKKIWTHFPSEKIYKTANITQKIYNLTKNQRFCLPFMSAWVESFDFSDYDIVIASSSWFTHWAITKPETKFIVYSHSPARYLWDWTNEYKRDIWWNKGLKWLILNRLFLKLRQWDFIASKRADITIANSLNTHARIKKYHRKKSIVIYPPIEWDRFNKKMKQKNIFWNYYIIVSALTEFKKIDVAIKAFNKMEDKKLIIVWDWNYRKNLEKLVNNPSLYEDFPWKGKKIKKTSNIIFTWFKSFHDLVWLVQNSMWFIFPWEEDFWIAPIEAMFAWKPVFAYRWWGLLETNIEWKTWDFFDDVGWKDFIEKFLKFDKKVNKWFYQEDNILKNAERFSSEKFEKNIRKIIL